MQDLLIKAATVIAVAFATFSSFPGTAQQETSSQQQSPQAQQNPSGAQQSPVQRNAGSAAMSNVASALKPVSGELVDNLDAKSAKRGDSVIVKTDQDMTMATGSEIPKGSKLVGHVTSVRPRGEGIENSQIAIQFDRAEVSGGRSLPIASVIHSIAPSAVDAPSTRGMAAGQAHTGKRLGKFDRSGKGRAKSESFRRRNGAKRRHRA
jgi:hypothetical protein